MVKGLKLEDLEVYKISMEIGELVWQIVSKWEYFEKKTLGVQFVNAADSMAFNISEGYCRFHFKKNKNFCYYSRGSAKETLTALHKARNRSLISENEFDLLSQKMDRYFRLMYGYISSIGHTENEES